MAVATAVAVSTTAVALVAGNGVARDVAVFNAGPNTVYIGGSAVTSTTGYPLTSGSDLVYPLGHSEILYGICASAESATARVLESQR
jgi:hypothetical protein